MKRLSTSEKRKPVNDGRRKGGHGGSWTRSVRKTAYGSWELRVVGSGMRGRRISRARTRGGVSIRGERMVGRQDTKVLRVGKWTRNRRRTAVSGVEDT